MSTQRSTSGGAVLMVVDDEPWLRRVFERVLSEDGYDVVTVDNGRDAISLFGKVHPDVVILDILMPDMDGMATLRELRRRSRKAHIVMLTALGTVQSAREAMLLGADEYITKPFDLEVLKLLLRDGLDAKRRGAGEHSCAV